MNLITLRKLLTDNEFRNRLLRAKEDTEPVDEILLKAIDAPEKRKSFFKVLEER